MLEDYDNFGNKITDFQPESGIDSFSSANLEPPTGLISNTVLDPTAPSSLISGSTASNLNIQGYARTGSGSVEGGISQAQSSSDVIFWAGSAVENRATAPFRVNAAGLMTSANLTKVGGLYTRTNVVSDATTVLTLPIPAGALGTTGTLRITMALTNNSGNGVIVTTRYGGTDFATDVTLGAGVGVLSKQVIDIINLNSASVQVSSATSQNISAITGLQIKTGTVNSAIAKNVTVLIKTAGGGIDCFVEFIFVEIIK